MFTNHRLWKIAGQCFIAAGLLLVCLTAAQAQGSRADSAVSYFARGREWQAKGELERAIADYDQALALNPHRAQIYANRGMAWLRLGQEDKAAADFAECLAFRPEMKSSLEERIRQARSQLASGR
jgi:tetratricopeptide (TPR) repeat protein